MTGQVLSLTSQMEVGRSIVMKILMGRVIHECSNVTSCFDYVRSKQVKRFGLLLNVLQLLSVVA